MSSYEFAILVALIMEANVNGSANIRGAIIRKITNSAVPSNGLVLDQKKNPASDALFIGSTFIHIKKYAGKMNICNKTINLLIINPLVSTIKAP